MCSFHCLAAVIYGTAVYMVVGKGNTAGFPTILPIAVSTDAPATVNTTTYDKITIKNESSERAIQFQLMRVN